KYKNKYRRVTMKKKWLLAGIILMSPLFLLACVSTETEENPQEDAVEETAPTHNEESLRLGDTAEIESNLGNYEMTVHSFETYEEFEDVEPSSGLFVLINYSVKNTGDEPIEANDIYNGQLEAINNEENPNLSRENSFHFSITAEGEIAPGEDYD